MIEPQQYGQQALQEYLLLDYVQRLETRKYGHRAVHIHMSRMKPFHRRDYHIRVATNTFESYVKLYVGRIFVLTNNDLIFVWKDKSIADVEPAVDTLRYLFRDDPLSQDDSEETGFCTWYNLNTEFQEFLLLCQHLDERAKKLQQNINMRAAQQRDKDETLQPIDAENLAQLEETIHSADLSEHIRQQPVCVFAHGGSKELHPVFDEFFVSITDLRNALMPKIDLASNRWLFQHMTEVLDKRMLNYLCKRTFKTHASSFSLNLNLGTLTSKDFDKFDETVRRKWPGNVIIELNQVDLFSNLETYLKVRDDFHERGYRILIDNLTVESLSFVDRKRLKADFIKVAWREEMTDNVIRKKYGEMDNLVKNSGRERVILCRCDSPTAIKFGQSLGITLFQGRYIDQMIARQRRAKRAAKAGQKPAAAKPAAPKPTS
ncbi:MAG TPA: EAL domain-containing protein [Thalassospira lucentensis]|uniref:EAL domain-containing protein n=3 Tax=Thalassospira lucentensis TaxID=168935 RepID=A0A3D5N607_9PROT|nr:EAL domain-containing protein [Thalassospira lucentensis]HCW66817.1 EAL domain-containing protein [Thalassospira lucentensis]